MKSSNHSPACREAPLPHCLPTCPMIPAAMRRPLGAPKGDPGLTPPVRVLPKHIMYAGFLGMGLGLGLVIGTIITVWTYSR